MKKLLSAILAFAMLLSFAACSGKEEIKLKDDYEITDIPLEIEKNLQKKYGSEYVIGMPADENYLTDIILIDMKDVDKFCGNYSDSMVRNDAVIVVKAKEGSEKTIEDAFLKYNDAVIERYENYPVGGSLERAMSAQVVVKGRYVIYLSIGDFNPETDAPQFDDDIKEAVETIQSLFI